MVLFVLPLDAAEDIHGVCNVWRVHGHWLETTFQCRISFNVLPVVVQRRRADRLHFTASERRFEDVGGIDSPFRRTGPNHCVHLIDEQHTVARLLEFVDYLLEAFFKFTTVLRASHKRGHVQRHYTLAREGRWDVARLNHLGQLLYDCSFTDAWFAD